MSLLAVFGSAGIGWMLLVLFFVSLGRAAGRGDHLVSLGRAADRGDHPRRVAEFDAAWPEALGSVTRIRQRGGSRPVAGQSDSRAPVHPQAARFGNR
jgi:hypothetical protein